MVALDGALPLVGVMLVAPLVEEAAAEAAAAAKALPPPEAESAVDAAIDSIVELVAEARFVPEALLDRREADLGGILAAV